MEIKKREIRNNRKLCSGLKFVTTFFPLVLAHMALGASFYIKKTFISDKGNTIGRYCLKFIKILNGFLSTKSNFDIL